MPTPYIPMHVLFVHQNFPAQFGHVARRLATLGHRCTFLSERARPNGWDDIDYRQYKVRGGATERNHYCSRGFENAIWRCQAVYEATKEQPRIEPDLIVAHSGFGSSLFLSELTDAPVINYFEYYFHPRNSDLDFRPDFRGTLAHQLRSRARNAMILLDLENCALGYSPTHWQHQQLPVRYHDKVRVVFDGIDTDIWRPVDRPDSRRLGRIIPKNARFVTYVSRGLESMRGFDVFMQASRLVAQRHPDVYFLVVGQDRCVYGDDRAVTGSESFKKWVLSRATYDLDRYLFLGRVTPAQLVEIFALSDVHVYLTVPFVLSWSLLNALSCGVPVIASNTGPVQEVIQNGENGVLVNFFDIETMQEQILAALDQPDALRATLGAAGRQLIEQKYSLDVCVPQQVELFEAAIQANKP
jgi:glycosyltransferase involved in cell wall biosynthesis